MSIKSLFSCCYSSANVNAIPTTPSDKADPKVNLNDIASEALNQNKIQPPVSIPKATSIKASAPLHRTQSSTLLSLPNETEGQQTAAPLRRTQSSPLLSLPKEAEKQPGAALTDLTIKEEEAPKTAVSYKRAALGFGLTALGLVIAGLAYRYFNQGSLPKGPANPVNNEIFPSLPNNESYSHTRDDQYFHANLTAYCKRESQPLKLFSVNQAETVVQGNSTIENLPPAARNERLNQAAFDALRFLSGTIKTGTQAILNAVANNVKAATSTVYNYAGSRLHDFMNKPKPTFSVGTPVRGSYNLNFNQ